MAAIFKRLYQLDLIIGKILSYIHTDFQLSSAISLGDVITNGQTWLRRQTLSSWYRIYIKCCTVLYFRSKNWREAFSVWTIFISDTQERSMQLGQKISLQIMFGFNESPIYFFYFVSSLLSVQQIKANCSQIP